MYPFFEPITGFIIYSFGLTLVICFFLFFWMLKKLGDKYSYDTSIFTQNILWYFLSVFIFSRLFYIISQWNDLKYINNPLEFFIMSDYYFSLFGALFGFFLVLYINVRLKKEKIAKYIDGVVLSFLFVAVVGFIGAFLGGQVYGRETAFGIEVLYTHPFTLIPYQSPIFPLAIVYSIVFFLTFSVLYMVSMFIKIRGFIGYMGLLVFSTLTFMLENFSGKYDIFKVHLDINMSQILSIVVFVYSFYKLYVISKIAGNDTTVLIDKK